MAQGHIEQAASAREIYVAPRNAYVARFIGGQNVLNGAVESVIDGTAAVTAEMAAASPSPSATPGRRAAPPVRVRFAATASPSRSCRPAPSRPAASTR